MTQNAMTDTNQSYATSVLVHESPHDVFEAVTNPRAWWSQTITGDTSRQDDVFEFEVEGVHYSKQELVEVVPDQRVVWRVTDATMTFLEDQHEWTGTRIVFSIDRDGDRTRLTFTHEGLVPDIECYKFCMPSWEQYVEGSLRKLITTGEGTPNLEGKSIEKPPAAES